MADAKEVAARLTKAEADWLLRHQDRLHTDDTLEAFVLADMGLAKPAYCPTAKEFGHIATRKGLAVRAILAEENTDE